MIIILIIMASSVEEDPLANHLSSRDDSAWTSDTLSFAEQMLLWSMRIWVVGLQKRIPVGEKLHEAYSRAGAPRAVGLVDNLMVVVGHGAIRQLDINCPCRKGLSEDERSILDLAALYQGGASLEGPLLLHSMLTETACRAAGGILRDLGRVFSDADMIFPPIDIPPERAFGRTTPHAGSPTLH